MFQATLCSSSGGFIVYIQLNEQLHKTHLECANLWPTTWQIIQTAIDSNIQSQMERHYINLNKKLDNLMKKHSENNTTPRDDNKHQFYTRIRNFTNINLTKEAMQLIKYGLNYSIEKPTSTYIANLIA